MLVVVWLSEYCEVYPQATVFVYITCLNGRSWSVGRCRRYRCAARPAPWSRCQMREGAGLRGQL